MYNIFFQQVKSLIYIKETAEKALKRLGIFNIRDLVFYKPYNYIISDVSSNLQKIKPNSIIQAEVIIKEIEISRTRKSPTKIYVTNDTGGLVLVFFNKIPSFIFARLKIGSKYIVEGRVQFFDTIPQITHPEFIFKKNLATPVEPIYHLTYGIINKQLYGYIIDAISAIEVSINSHLSFKKIEDNSLIESMNEQLYMTNLLQEIKNLHLINIIDDSILIDKTLDLTNKKLAKKELLVNQISLSRLKKLENKSIGYALNIDHNLKKNILNSLNFSLTNAQSLVIREIEHDQSKPLQMMRLLQGDVGSGKT